MYRTGSFAYLDKDFRFVAQELLLAHHSSYLRKTWEDILETVPENFFEEKDAYIPVEESVIWLEKMLEYNNIPIASFVNDVHTVMNKRLPKKNSLLLLGKPNSGKTMICDSVVSSVVYSEVVSTFNGMSSFEFQPFLAKRAVLMNEPKITDKTVEMLKNILEGQTVSIDVKFKSGQTLTRTPIFIASNENLTFYTSARESNLKAFKARCFEYTLQPYDELKHCAGKLHPLMWKDLIAQYIE